MCDRTDLWVWGEVLSLVDTFLFYVTVKVEFSMNYF